MDVTLAVADTLYFSAVNPIPFFIIPVAAALTTAYLWKNYKKNKKFECVVDSKENQIPIALL